MEVNQVRRIHQHTPVQHVWTLIIPAMLTIKYRNKWLHAREIYGAGRELFNARTDKTKTDEQRRGWTIYNEDGDGACIARAGRRSSAKQ